MQGIVCGVKASLSTDTSSVWLFVFLPSIPEYPDPIKIQWIVKRTVPDDIFQYILGSVFVICEVQPPPAALPTTWLPGDSS